MESGAGGTGTPGAAEGRRDTTARRLAPAAADLGRLAIAWGTAAIVILATVAVASLSFVYRREARSKELDRYYSRAIERASEHFALRFENDRQVVDSVTQGSAADKLHSYDSECAEDDGLAGGRSAADGLCRAQHIAAGNRTHGLTIQDCPQEAKWGEAIVKDEMGKSFFIFPPSPGPRATDRQPPPKLCGAVAVSDFVGPLSTTEARRAALQNATHLDDVVLFQDDRSVPLGDGGMGLVSLPPENGPPRGARVARGVEVGPAKVRVYLRQVDVEVHGPDGKRVVFTLAGLVDEDRLAREADMIPPGTFYWAVLVVAAVALSLPLAKLWFLGRLARLRRLDVAFLATAAVVAVLVSSILFLTALANNRWSMRLDQRLANVGRQARDRLAVRLDAAARSLNGLVLDNAPRPDGTIAPIAPEQTHFFARRWEPDVFGLAPAKGLAGSNLSWTAAFLATAQGDSIARFVPGDHAPSVINIKDRPYFRRALDGDVRCLAMGGPPDAEKCPVPAAAAEVLRSVASGKISLYLARRTNWSEASVPDRADVAGILVGVDDFLHPQLPLGFALAVLDEKGTVLLHSEHDAHHGESFFADVDDPRDLQATIAVRTGHALDMRYAGVSSRAYVEPLAAVGWDVVVWANRDVIEVPTTDLVVITACALALLAAGLLVATAAGCIVWIFVRDPRRRRVAFHLRPGGAHPRTYAALAVRASAAAAVLCLLSLVLPAWVPGAVLLVIELCAMVWFGQRLQEIQDPHKQCRIGDQEWGEAWSSMPHAHACALFALTGIFLVAPTFTVFRTAYDYVSSSVLVAEKMHLDTARELESTCLAPRPGGEAEARSENTCPHVFDGDPRPRATPEDARSKWLEGMLFAPLLDRFPPLPGVHGDRSARWYRTGATARETLPLCAPCDYDPWRIATLMAGFLVVGLLAHWVAYRSLRRLFFIDVSIALRSNQGPPPDARSLTDCRQSILVIHPPASLVEELAALCVDVGAPLGAGASGEAVTRGPRDVGLVRDLGALLGSPAGPMHLRRAFAQGRPVIILSSVDPWRRLTGALRTEWAKVLEGCVVKLCGPDMGEKSASPGEPEKPSPTSATVPGTKSISREAKFIVQWCASDDDERRVLAQLAIDHHPSPHRGNCATMGHLARRGLLDPCTLTIDDRHFAAFIASEVTTTDLDRIEREQGPNAWKTLRIPLVTAASALLAMLAQGSPELQATGVIFPAVFAATQVILKALGTQDPPVRT
jgi:hypothetical protein